MIFGWDISTSIIGVSIFDKDGKYLASEHLDLRKLEGVFVKADAAEFFVRTVIGKHGLHGGNVHFVEERLANFSSGKTMLQTLMTLAAFNLLVSWFIYCTDKDVRYIHPSTVKAIMKREGLVIPKGADKKKLTLSFVQANVVGWRTDLNKNANPQPWNYDRADAYCVARAGYLRNYLGNGEGTEATGTQGTPGTGADPQG